MRLRDQVEIIEQGAGEGPLVLMLPGLGNRGAGFRPLARALSRWMRPVIVEYPEGHHAATGAATLARDVASVVGPMDGVIASSFGGMVAAHFAQISDVRGVAFLGSFTQLDQLGVRASLIRLMGPVAMMGHHVAPLLATVAAFGHVPREHVEDVIPSSVPERTAVLHRSWAIPGESRGVELSGRALSCVAIQGSHDVLVPASTLRRLAKALPPGSRTHLLKGAGHVPYLTHVEQCVERLRPWIDSLRAEPAEERAA